MKKIELNNFDPAEYLKTEEDFAGYLEECAKLDDGDGKMILAAMNTIIRAKGLSKVAKEIRMTRQGLAKAFSAQGNPEVTTFFKVLRSLGIRMSAKPACVDANYR